MSDIHVIDVGDEVPDFSLDSQFGPASFHPAIDGHWCVLVTFRNAFDPVHKPFVFYIQIKYIFITASFRLHRLKLVHWEN